MISKDTLCEKAKLHFNKVPAVLICLDCKHEYHLEDELQPCPNCGSARVRVLTGDEFNIHSIEIQRES